MLNGKTINTEIFTASVRQDLIPKLPENSLIVMDNASFHKGAEMRTAIKMAGHKLLYLPPYSPDLNPIAHNWAQAKSIRKKRFNIEIEELFKLKQLYLINLDQAIDPNQLLCHAQSSHSVSNLTSLCSTVGPHQMRKDGGRWMWLRIS